MADDTGVFEGLPDVFTDTFGETVTFTPAGGLAREIIAIFRDRFALVDGIASVGLEDASAVLHARQADVDDAAHGDGVTVRGSAYVVRGIEPDGRGMVRLIIKES